VYFYRFWRRSRDRLFLWFSSAFVLLAVSYLMLGTVQFASEWRIYVFAVRLFAFCLILCGIFEKNRR
jgi:hypothetical protein